MTSSSRVSITFNAPDNETLYQSALTKLREQVGVAGNQYLRNAKYWTEIILKAMEVVEEFPNLTGPEKAKLATRIARRLTVDEYGIISGRVFDLSVNTLIEAYIGISRGRSSLNKNKILKKLKFLCKC